MGKKAKKDARAEPLRPKSGDKADVRCAFVLDRPGRHDLGAKPDQSWCFGCAFYVCDGCDSPFGAPGIGKHDVNVHDPNSEEA